MMAEELYVRAEMCGERSSLEMKAWTIQPFKKQYEASECAWHWVMKISKVWLPLK